MARNLISPAAIAALVSIVGTASAEPSAELPAPPAQPCEGRWSLRVRVTKETVLCRKGKPFKATFDVLASDGKYRSRLRPRMEQSYTIEATPGTTCRLRWHDELVTTVASPYDLMVTDYDLEVTAGTITGTGRRSEATVGMAASCSEKLEVTGTWRPLSKRDSRLRMRRMRKDLGELLELIPQFCHQQEPNLQGVLTVELTVSGGGGVYELAINGQPFSIVEHCDRILSENLVNLFPNPTGVEQKVKLEVDATPRKAE